MSTSSRLARFMPDPQPGMRATIHGWSFGAPAIVVYVNGDFVAVRSLASTIPAGEFYWFRVDHSGKYVQYEMDGIKGIFIKIKDGNGLTIIG